jgi:hypothetical protein
MCELSQWRYKTGCFSGNLKSVTFAATGFTFKDENQTSCLIIGKLKWEPPNHGHLKIYQTILQDFLHYESKHSTTT